MWAAFSDERTGLSFTIASGTRQRSHFRVLVLWDSWPYFTVSDSRLPFSSPPTIRRATVEVFELASIRKSLTATKSESQSQSYVTTDGQSFSLSSNKAPIWGLWPELYYSYCLTVTGFLMWGALSDERTGLSFFRVIVSSSKSLSVCTIHILHVIKRMYICMYNMYNASVSAGSVQQIMPYY
jgi:hypothetical protein